MNFKIGDKVVLNERYFREGKQFGKNLKYSRDKNHFFVVKEIISIDHERVNSELVIVDGGKYKGIAQIASCFLEKKVTVACKCSAGAR
jgi:hypothetical protein